VNFPILSNYLSCFYYLIFCFITIICLYNPIQIMFRLILGDGTLLVSASIDDFDNDGAAVDVAADTAAITSAAVTI